MATKHVKTGKLNREGREYLISSLAGKTQRSIRSYPSTRRLCDHGHAVGILCSYANEYRRRKKNSTIHWKGSTALANHCTKSFGSASNPSAISQSMKISFTGDRSGLFRPEMRRSTFGPSLLPLIVILRLGHQCYLQNMRRIKSIRVSIGKSGIRPKPVAEDSPKQAGIGGQELFVKTTCSWDQSTACWSIMLLSRLLEIPERQITYVQAVHFQISCVVVCLRIDGAEKRVS